MIALAAVLCAALWVPLAGRAPLACGGDGLVLVYVLGMAAIALILTALATGSPYAYAGGTREMMLFLVVEPVLVIALICAMVHAHSWRIEDLVDWQLEQGPSLSLVVAALALLLALPAQFAKLPFDIAEADQEIMGGPLVELSGPKLALFKWTVWARQFVLAGVLVTIFVPWPGGLGPLTLLLNLAKICLAFVVVGLIDVVCPRLRVDQALGWYVSVIVVAGIAVVLAVVAG
jgi:formate hydrogenlyase subunit 4